MEDQPPEPTLTLSFLKGDLRKKFQELWLQCLRTRDYGIDYFMDHGRALGDIRMFLYEHAISHLDTGFAIICDKLETTPSEARKRISLANTWDALRQYLDDKGSPIRMPRRVSHIDTLHAIEDIAQRPLAWEQMYSEATDQQITITAKWMDTWITKYKPVPLSEGVPAGLEDDEVQADGEVQVTQPIKEDVPRGTPTAKVVHKEVTPGEGPHFKHPPEAEKCIDRIASLCGGNNPQDVAEWRRLIGDPIKIKFQDLRDWDAHDDDAVRKIGRLIHGNLDKGLRDAIRIVERRVDLRTPLSAMLNHCIAEGGRWEHIEGQFRIMVTLMKRPHEP